MLGREAKRSDKEESDDTSKNVIDSRFVEKWFDGERGHITYLSGSTRMVSAKNTRLKNGVIFRE